MRSLGLLGLALLAFVACGREEGGEPARQEGRVLEPLPPPPALQIEQEAAIATGPLEVVVSRPEGEARGDVRPAITFNKPVITLGAEPPPDPARLEPPVPGEWRWLGSASVEFVPDAPLPYSTEFGVTVRQGLRAVDGSELEEPHVFSFRTPRPRLQRVQPRPGNRWLRSDGRFELTFDQPVAELARHVSLRVGGTPYAVRIESEVSVAEEARRAERRRYDRMQAPPRNLQTRYVLAPEAALPLDAEVELTIDGALRGAQGPLTMGAPVKQTFRTYGSMKFLSVRPCVWSSGQPGHCPFGPLVLLSSNAVDLETLKSRLRIEPSVEIDWDRASVHFPEEWSPLHDPWVVVPGAFRPGTRYEVRIDAGVKDEFGQVAPAFEGSFTTDDRAAHFSAGSSQALIESEGDGTLPLESVNLHYAAAHLWDVSPAEMARLLAKRERPGRQADLSLDLDLSAERNRTKITPLPVREALGDQRNGLFVARLLPSGLPWNADELVFGQLTDLAVHAKLGATSGVVWVTRLSNGRPVAGVDLELFDRRGEVRWKGKTDDDGIARVEGLARLIPAEDRGYRWEAPFALVSASLGDELGMTLSTWQDGLSPGAFDLQMAWEGGEPKSAGLLFTERGIYRPGDEVHVKGIARFRRFGELRMPAAGKIASWTLRDARAEVVARGEFPITPFGTFAGRVELPASVSLGTFSLVADVADEGKPVSFSTTFRVEEYRAPQFRVDVTLSQPSYVAGDELRGNVLSRYLFGGAMSDAKVRHSLQRNSVPFAPPGHEGFSFGNRAWFWDDEGPGPSRELVASGDGQVDGSGALALDLGRAEAPASRTWEYVLEAEVEDVNRQRVANRAAALVHPAAVYAGVREVSSGFAEVGKPARFELVAVTPDGKRAEGAPLSVQIQRREWKSIRKKGAGGEWFTTTEVVQQKVAECRIASASTPQPCAFTPEEPGLYTVEATVKDEDGRTQLSRHPFYVTGGGWVSWQRNDTDRIDLVADKQLYAPGETAKILVKSPYPEAEALLTVERSGVTSARRVQLKGSATTLEVPIDDAAVPNVYVGLVLVRGRVAEGGLESGDDPGRPAVKFGYVQLRVEKREKRLAVELSPDASEKRPRDKVRVAVQVRDHAGRGAPAEVTVWAVDEAVLRLTGYQVPDPIEAIYPPQGLSVRIGEPLLHLVQRRLYGEKGSTAGGGGGDGTGAGFRTQFRTTVLFAPTIQTDAQGRAQVEFELPDNLTTYRLMAVAVGRDERFGNGSGELRVAKPLLALAALPRLARVGDRFEAGVVVHAHRFAGGEVQVRAEAEGLTLQGSSTQRAEVVEGKPQEIRFHFVAEAPGTATLRFAVEGGGERDGLEQRLPIHLPVALETLAVYGDTKTERIEGLQPPDGVREGVGGLQITLASTALGGFGENLDQLVEYPYGCLEQEASRLVPFVALRELFGRYGLPWSPQGVSEWVGAEAIASQGASDPDELIRKTLSKIAALQNHDGGYRYWSTSPCSSHFASAYAVLALGRAKEVGFAVDAESLERGQRFLAERVLAGECERCFFGCNKPSDATRVFAAWVLARTGAPRSAYYGELFERRKELPLFGQAMLADAMFVGGGDRAQARKLLGELLVFAKETAAQVHFQEQHPRTYASLWSSDTRTSALVLQALVDIAPDHPYVGKLTRYLSDVRGKDGRYRSTQEAAFSLMALTEVARVKESEVPDFEARVLLAGKELLRESFEGRSMEIRSHELPLSKLGGGGELAFRKEGEGVLHYSATLRYAPKELPMTALERGFTVQRWFEPYAGGGQAKRFFAGELVRVRVRVAAPAERHFAVISVPLPAGLEAVDTTLASTARLPEAAEEGEGYEYESAEDTYEEGIDEPLSLWADRFYSPFNHTERRDDRVVLFADRLPPGIHVASFVARATTPGRFLLQPASAEEMYAPEVYGRSEGGELEVLLGSPVAER